MKKKNEVEMKKKRSRGKVEKSRRKQYSEDDIKKALDAIKNGMAKKQAAKKYQVPRATLQFRIKKPEHKLRPGTGPVLSIEEENKLKDWLNVSHTKGFPKRKEDLLNSVYEFITRTGRPNPFKNNIPGDKWFKLFLKRHPDIAIRTPDAITAASAAVSENDIKGWFQVIEIYLKDNGLLEILSDPKRVLNGDETNFVLCAKTGLVLAPKGAKNVYEIDHTPAKSSLTVMFTFAASGEITPPMVIFPYKRLPSEIAAKVPSDWGIGLSENGWMKNEIFSQYIEKVLHPHLVRNQIPFPVILFVDGHKTHVTFAVSELCSSLNIILIALYPNCTRLLQPADVSAFRPLKGGWQKTVLEWRRDNPSQALTKVDFVPLLQKTIDKCVKPETIINGFHATGLYPWDSNAIDYSKCLGKNLKNTLENKTISKTMKMLTKEDFIKYTGQSTIKNLIVKQDLTAAEKNLKNLWCFFDENEDQPTENERNKAKEMNKMNENSDNSIKDNNRNEEIYQKNTTFDKQYLDIENMEIVLCDEFDTHTIPVAEELVIENKAKEENINCIIDTKETDYIRTYEQVTHTIQVELHKEPKNCRLNRPFPYKNPFPTSRIVNPDQKDLDKIKILETVSNPTFTTPIKTNLREIKLDDVLVLPQTPKRKGIRRTKKTSYVITSKQFKEEELQKIKAKKDKEEGIQKRKEQRQQKKTEQMLKKEEKSFKKQVAKKHDTTESVKRKILSEDCSYNNENKANLIRERNDKDKKKINKEQKTNKKSILCLEETCCAMDENEKSDVNDDDHIRANKKLSISEIEKMLIDN